MRWLSTRQDCLITKANGGNGREPGNRKSKKQTAGTHESIPAVSNYDLLALVGKSNAKADHSKILVITIVPGFNSGGSIEYDL